MIKNLTIQDFENLLEKVTSNAQIDAVVMCLDACWRDDPLIMSADDWPRLVRLVADKKFPECDLDG